jgi:DhnA family fructose-bisphosphate aldolase class Ia
MCQYSRDRAKKLKKEPLKMTLETFDRQALPNFKGQLIGPSSEAVRVATEVKVDAGFAEFGLLYDLSHMFLIHEGFDHEVVSVIRELAPYLNWVHLANSISDPNDPLYGDMHPGMDHPNGNVTPDVVKAFFKELVDIRFEGGIGLELMPYGDQLSENVVMNGINSFTQGANQIVVNYAVGGYRFKTRKFLPERLFYKITEERIRNPQVAIEELKKRKRRAYPWDSNLIIIAADHPARFVTRVGDDPIGMGDRQQYLGRIARTLISNEIDGLMATPDIIEDLAILNKFFVTAGGQSFLDNKILIGCTNRSGLAGSTYEMDDAVTAYTVKEIKEIGLDGAKMMFRLDLETSQARYSQQTLIRCAEMVRACASLGVPAFVEPLPVEQTPSGYRVKMNHEDLIKTIGVATAIGGTTGPIWLKVPYVENFELVARSTSNPILLLGGDAQGDPTNTIINFEKGLGAGPNIKGALVGRNMLFPGYDDPLAVALGVARVIHNYETAEQAVKYIAQQRGTDMEHLTKVIYKPATN